jgi:hypothetical protein
MGNTTTKESKPAHKDELQYVFRNVLALPSADFLTVDPVTFDKLGLANPHMEQWKRLQDKMINNQLVLDLDPTSKSARANQLKYYQRMLQYLSCTADPFKEILLSRSRMFTRAYEIIQQIQPDMSGIPESATINEAGKKAKHNRHVAFVQAVLNLKPDSPEFEEVEKLAGCFPPPILNESPGPQSINRCACLK